MLKKIALICVVTGVVVTAAFAVSSPKGCMTSCKTACEAMCGKTACDTPSSCKQ